MTSRRDGAAAMTPREARAGRTWGEPTPRARSVTTAGASARVVKPSMRRPDLRASAKPAEQQPNPMVKCRKVGSIEQRDAPSRVGPPRMSTPLADPLTDMAVPILEHAKSVQLAAAAPESSRIASGKRGQVAPCPGEASGDVRIMRRRPRVKPEDELAPTAAATIEVPRTPVPT